MTLRRRPNNKGKGKDKDDVEGEGKGNTPLPHDAEAWGDIFFSLNTTMHAIKMHHQQLGGCEIRCIYIYICVCVYVCHCLAQVPHFSPSNIKAEQSSGSRGPAEADRDMSMQAWGCVFQFR